MKKKISIVICFMSLIIGLFGTAIIFNTQKKSINISNEVYATEETELPEYYCLRDEYVLPTQNQSSSALCWDFASSTVLTTAILKRTNQYVDFSEAWISTARAHNQEDYKPGDVGNFNKFDENVRNSGLVLEQDFNFENSFWTTKENTDDLYNYYSNFADKDLINNYQIVYFNQYQNFHDENRELYLNAMKQHIIENSAIYCLCHWTATTTFYNGQTIYYKKPQATGSAHAITIIGWDDNIVINTNEQSYTGAWIILNSYGNTSGNCGIWYAVFDDTDLYQIRGYKPKNNDDNLYLTTKIIQSNGEYVTDLKGNYYGDFTASNNITKQKNIFFNTNNINITYSYDISNNSQINEINIYQFENCVSNDFMISININNKTINIQKNNCDIGAYKIVVSYSNENENEFVNIPFYVCNETEIAYVNISSSSSTYMDGSIQYFGNLNTNLHDIVLSVINMTGGINFNLYFGTYSKIEEIRVYNANDENDYYTTGKNLSFNLIFDLNKTNNYGIEVITPNCNRYISVNILYNNQKNDVVLINYHLNNGINNQLNLKRNIISNTGDIKLYSPTKEGYGFLGWYTSPTFENETILKNSHDEFYIQQKDVINYSSATLYTTSNFNSYIKKSNIVFVYAKWIKLENNKTYHKIITSCYGDGVVNPKGITYVEDGDNKFVSIDVKNCYVAKIIVNNIKVDDNLIDNIIANGYNITNIQNDIYIDVYFVPNNYIKYFINHWKESTPSYDSVEVDGKYYKHEQTNFEYGAENTQSQAEPNEYNGYTAKPFSQITINENNNEINIYYDKNSYSIDVNYIGYKDNSLNTTYTVKYGDNLTINFSQMGYNILSYSLDDETYYENSCTISNISFNHTINVNLEKIKFALNITCNQGGIIVPNKDELFYGEEVIFQIQLQNGYEISSITLNGNQVIIQNYIFKIESVFEDVNINAEFIKKLEYHVNHWKETNLLSNSVEVGGKLYILEETTILYAYKNTQSQASAKEYIGYHANPFSQITINDDNSVINIYYDKNEYTVNVIFIGYKDNSLNTTYTVKYGDNLTINFSQTGYNILSYSLDNETYYENICTISNINSNHSIQVNLEIIKFAVNINCNKGGLITIINDEIEYGGDAIFGINVDNGYVLYKLTVNGNEITTENNRFKVENVQEELNIDAQFLTNREYDEIIGIVRPEQILTVIIIIGIIVLSILLGVISFIIMNKRNHDNYI